MGSRPSTISESSPTAPRTPHLPVDVHFEIISHLNPDRDRQTLLSVALCCSAFRDSSQRILFNSMRLGWQDYSDAYQIINSHIRFLQTIADSPDRLAMFVRSYSQVGLALGPSLLTSVEAQHLQNKRDRVMLWNLTARALPFMVNLQNFFFKPGCDHHSVPSILIGCTFHLESFTWMGKGNEERLFDEFLPSQPGLLHLDINSSSLNKDKLLPDDLCTNLLSVACTFSAFAKIAEGRPITAFHLVNSMGEIMRPLHVERRLPTERRQYLGALKRLKYLHLWSLLQFQSFTSGIPLSNVIVLELTILEDNTLSEQTSILATQFPQLRILRLWDQYSSKPIVDHSTHREVAGCALGDCPGLEVVIFSGRRKNSLTWVFSKEKGGDLKEEAVDANLKEFDRDVWWKVYNV